MTLSTNEIDFGTVSPLEGNKKIEDAISVTIQSNTEYAVHMKAIGDFVNSNGEDKIPLSNLKYTVHGLIDISNVSTSDTLVTGMCGATSGATYKVDFDLTIPWSVKHGNYKTELIFTVSDM